ncbi:ABC transporter permease [Aestuariimicrobium soli]|uniref:ABC transporter permease n=1 Tax=Aestuariimicrobium soli TaxID=2035834 RepID=UPI003EBB77D3
MNPRLALATAQRCLRQLAHDRRTIALILVVPVLLLFLLHAMFDGDARIFNSIGLIMLGIFPFIIMFLVTSIAMLRERTTGTLERLLTTPVDRADLLAGYALAFGLMAALQALVAVGAAYWLFDLDTKGSAGWVVLIAVLNALLGVSLGLFASAFARTEFQAVQFMPLVVFPQLLSAGLFSPRDRMADWLHALSTVFPLTYAVEALQQVGAHAEVTSTLWRDLAVIGAVLVVCLALAALTLRRRTP